MRLRSKPARLRTTGARRVAGPTLVARLAATRIPWRAYVKGLTVNAHPGAITKAYNPHRNPFVGFQALRGNADDRSRVLGFAALKHDLARGRLPIVSGMLRP